MLPHAIGFARFDVVTAHDFDDVDDGALKLQLILQELLQFVVKPLLILMQLLQDRHDMRHRRGCVICPSER
jgi:hypothetical protein